MFYTSQRQRNHQANNNDNRIETHTIHPSIRMDTNILGHSVWVLRYIMSPGANILKRIFHFNRGTLRTDHSIEFSLLLLRPVVGGFWSDGWWCSSVQQWHGSKKATQLWGTRNRTLVPASVLWTRSDDAAEQGQRQEREVVVQAKETWPGHSVS